ncbi:sensor histidine kinase [Maricaulaceae bacterium EIL42A08]|nr:sensor histidine kinase [Maricaulaceae bacterium EIL42A08]
MNDQREDRLTPHGSLARRMVGFALIWALGLLIVGAVALTVLFRQTVLGELDDRLARVNESLLAFVEIDSQGQPFIEQRPTDPSYSQVFSGRYWQITREGAEGDLASSSLAELRLDVTRLAAQATASPGETFIGTVQGPDSEPLRVHVQAVVIEGVEGAVIIAAAEDRRPADADVLRFAIIASILFSLLAAALALGVWFQVRVGLEPVLRMGRAVASVRDGEEARVSGQYPSELIPLAGELNSLLDHSREVVERARTHVGNLAHALKTPITVLGNEARTSSGALAELVGRQTDAMSAQVEHHLRRARAAANAQAIGARAPATEVLEDLTRTLRKIYQRREVSVTLDAPDGLVFRGERQDLEDLAGNLIDNACKWAAGEVKVAARSVAGDDMSLCICVDDDGPGLDDAACAQVLERGVRLDEQAPGTGLGLAIVTDLARAYGGYLKLGRSVLGGLKAELRLPGARGIKETGR